MGASRRGRVRGHSHHDLAVAAAVGACLCVTVTALPPTALLHRESYNAHLHAQQQRLQASAGAQGLRGSTRFLTQRLDHLDRQNDATFQQRYFINDTFFRAGGGSSDSSPVFLCVGGEGPPLDESVLLASVHCNDMIELGARRGALLLALEHRYYGESQPFDDFGTANLRWLSSQQALGDLVHFHEHITRAYHLTASHKWVAWGGSYPGMMAAYARQLHPSLFYAAVSSSSPLHVALDFPEYNEVVSRSMADPLVGGSNECLDVIAKGHEQIGHMLTTRAGRLELSSLFHLCNTTALDDHDNRRLFAGDGVVFLPVQSNDPACQEENCDIAGICRTLLAEMDGGGQPVHALAALSRAQHQGACMAVSLRDEVRRLKDVRNPERTWIYQTCTEFGFYQTCPKGSACPYTQGLHTLDQDLSLCQDAFDIDPAAVASQVAYTSEFYGSDRPGGSRILLPNGQVDPWSALGVHHAPTPSEPTLSVAAASHHAWTHPSLPTDQPEVVEARQVIWYQVDTWLDEDPDIIERRA